MIKSTVKAVKQFEIDAVLEQFELLMDFIESTLEMWDVEREWIEKICLLADEALMNIIYYAYPDGPGKVSLTMMYDEQAVQMDVRDTGIPFDPTLFPDPDVTLPLDTRPVGGLGIHFMRKLLDILQYRREGDCNHLVLKINTGRNSSVFEQSALLDDEEAVVNVLLATEDTELRAMILSELEETRFRVWVAETPERLEGILKKQCGIQLALLDKRMAPDRISEHAHHLKTRQQTPYVYVLMLTEQGDCLPEAPDPQVDDLLFMPFDYHIFRRHLDVAARTLDYEFRLLAQRLAHGQAIESLAEQKADSRRELKEAAEYVSSLLPLPQEEPVRIRWRFSPRSFLSGDFLGYQWLDDDCLAFYQLDSCAYGFRAALFSVAVQNMLTTRILPEINRQRPSEILDRLNRQFPMEKHSAVSYTMWAGIYHLSSETLYYSSGGHPPAILLHGEDPPCFLTTNGPSLGSLKSFSYVSRSHSLAAGARLILYTDGVIKNSRANAARWTPETLADLLRRDQQVRNDEEALDRITRELNRGSMEDDCCLLSLTF
ncbi:MAG: SpoIIE family protein phosphatase [Kiritimatiellae bacterium]|nr:SpoIIE family protein phosphatase [Kiritimatiellia bacterium]